MHDSSKREVGGLKKKKTPRTRSLANQWVISCTRSGTIAQRLGVSFGGPDADRTHPTPERGERCGWASSRELGAEPKHSLSHSHRPSRARSILLSTSLTLPLLAHLGQSQPRIRERDSFRSVRATCRPGVHERTSEENKSINNKSIDKFDKFPPVLILMHRSHEPAGVTTKDFPPAGPPPEILRVQPYSCGTAWLIQ